MHGTPAAFPIPARRRGCVAILKMIARAFDADRVVLWVSDSDLPMSENIHGLGIVPESDARPLRYRPASESLAEFQDVSAECRAVLETRQARTRHGEEGPNFYGVPLLDPDRRCTAVLGIVGFRPFPFPETSLEILAEARDAILEFFPLPAQRPGFGDTDIDDPRKREKRLEHDFNTAHSVILVFDPQLRITFANPYATNLLGFAFHDDEACRRDPLALFEAVVHPEDYDSFVRLAFGEEEPEGYLTFRTAAEGAVSYFALRSTPIRDGDGNVLSRITVIQDITDQKTAARALENYRSYLSLLAEIRKSFYSRSEQEIVRTFLEAATQDFNLDKAWYGIRIGESVRPVFHAGQAREFIDAARVDLDSNGPIRSFPLRRALRENRPVAINDLQHHADFEPWQDFARNANVHATLALPIEINGKIEAGIVFYACQVDAFDESIIDYLYSGVRELARITTEKRRWARQQRTLKKAKETAEAAARSKTQFLANMSHEIRTPMTSILGYSEILLSDYLAPVGNRNASNLSAEDCWKILEQCKGTVKIVQTNAEYLLAILNDVLDFSKIESDKLAVERLDVPILSFLNELASVFSEQAKKKKLGFSVNALTPLPETMHTDPVRLKQVLINLIGNALKFTPSGGIAVSVAWIAEDRADPPEPAGTSSGAPCRGSLFFTVKDTGIGISAEHLDSLFAPFHQADTSTTRRFGGTGLGLTISKRLIRLLGGELTVTSRKGVGSTFTAMLPQTCVAGTRWKSESEITDGILLRSLSTVFAKAADSWTDPAVTRPLADLRILLAEDGDDNRRLFSFILQKAGADVSIAENGRDAVEMSLRNLEAQTPFDVILMDMQMPVMDGYTATRQLRIAGYARPIVALTAHVLVEERQKCLNAGCDDYLSKPILRRSLIAAVLKNVRRKTATDEETTAAP